MGRSLAGSSALCVRDCSNNLTHALVLSMAVSSQPNAQDWCSVWLLLHSQTHQNQVSASFIVFLPFVSATRQRFQTEGTTSLGSYALGPALPCATGRDRADISSRVKRTSRPPTLPCCIGRTYHSRTAPSLTRTIIRTSQVNNHQVNNQSTSRSHVQVS